MADQRNLECGWPIPSECYSDQPYVVKAKDGAWVMVITTGGGEEGASGQHVVSARSLDCGKTWIDQCDVESAKNPESSYAVLYAAPYGRIFCFYNYNKDNLRQIPSDFPEPFTRVDSQGHFGFKYSDDCGKSWSAQYYEIPVRLMRIDREDNPTGGRIPFFWNVGKPLKTGEGLCVPLYKIGHIGEGTFINTEGVLNLCRNIDTEQDPARLTWQTLPDGDEGIHADRSRYGHVSEEQSFVRLSDGTVFTTFRTQSGHPFCAYSYDEGHTFTEPQLLRYYDGRPVWHPRAANFIWRCENGKYLYWHHNHAGKDYEDRNPAFLSGGVEVKGARGMELRLSEPEVVLYHPNSMIRFSYPDLIEEGGEYYITETDKLHARTHRVSKELLELLWQQAEGMTMPDRGVPVNGVLPPMPNFVKRQNGGDYCGLPTESSFAFSFQYNACRSECALNAMKNGIGFRVDFDGERLCWRMTDGMHSFFLESPTLAPGEHKVAVLLDGGAHLCRFVIDGHGAAPEEGHPFPFGKFDWDLQWIGKGQYVHTAPSVRELCYYSGLVTAPEMVMMQEHR